MSSAKGPFSLVTVNTAPERAKMIIGQVVESVKDDYIINYIANATRIEDVPKMIDDTNPDVLFCASMWTSEESRKIIQTAQEKKPGIKTLAIPHGLQVSEGPNAVLRYLKENIPMVLDHVDRANN